MDRIAPATIALPAAELREAVESRPAGGSIRLQFEGFDFDGNAVSKLVLLELGPEGAAEARLRNAGLGLLLSGDMAQVTDVAFGSAAGRYGIAPGMRVTEVLLPNPERWPKEVMFLPALVLVGLVFAAQRRRLPHTQAARAAAPAG
jgi:hypothetical protein